MEFPSDDALLSAVKAAIETAGGITAVAKATGIPVGTLNKYASGTSMPSLANAAKIAKAANVTVDSFTAKRGEEIYKLSPTEIAQFAARLVSEVQSLVMQVHSEEKVKLPPAALTAEAQRFFDVLLLKLDRIGDFNEATALMSWLENRIRTEVREAAAAPGTGKREAS